MVARLIHLANRHLISLAALACSLLALAGGAYAALRIPNGSVGEKQLKNQVIDPVKWDPIYVTAFLRRWAHVDATGRLLSGSSGAQSTAIGGTGNYYVTWHDAFNSNCQPIATVESGNTTITTTTPSTTTSTTSSTTTTTGATTITTTAATTTTPGPGFANTDVILQPNNATVISVNTYNSAGARAAEPFYLAVTCPRGAGGGQTFPFNLP